MITKIQSYFIDFPSQSKLWVFMAERSLTIPEQKVIETFMNQFIPQWKAHGDALNAAYELINNQFIIITVDETPAAASGCSIDAMTRFIKEIERKLGVSFTNRMLVSYIENNEMVTESLLTFKERVKKGEIERNTIVYNNSVSNLSDFWDNWMQPLNKSWAASLLPESN